jgi:hypothetical protein
LAMVRATRAAFDLEGGRLDGLESRLCDAIATLEELAHPFAANTLASLANLYLLHAQFDRADEVFARAVAANPGWYERAQLEHELAWCALLGGRIESATSRAASAIDMAERTGDPDLTAHAIEVAANVALARGETALAHELFVRTLTVAAEHDLPMYPYALIGVAVVSALSGDVAVACRYRDELEAQSISSSEMEVYRRSTSAFVDLVSGDADKAASVASDVARETEIRGQIYLHLLSLELLAASVANTDPSRARKLLASADEQRAAVGATPWPLDPYRHVALQTLALKSDDAMVTPSRDL